MEGSTSEGMAPVMNRLQELGNTPQETDPTAQNFTPLSEHKLNWIEHLKERALNAWRSIIHKNKNTDKSDTLTQNNTEPKSPSRRAFLAGAAAVAATMMLPKGAEASDNTGSTPRPQEKAKSPEQKAILTAHEYTPPNPSPDFRKGQEIGYVQAIETFEDGSKIWPLDWHLRPIHPEDMVYNLPGQRSLGSFIHVTHHLNLGREDNGRYAPVDNGTRVTTFCNVAASDMADIFQVHPVFSRFDENGRALLANNMHDRIIKEASRTDTQAGVVLIDRLEAQRLANSGYPVFLSIKKEKETPNAQWMNGHIGLVTPQAMLNAKDPHYRQGALFLVQAGSESGDAVYYDEENKYNEANGYSQPIFAIDTRDLRNARQEAEKVSVST